jgi:hypothetical protein
MRKQTNPPEPVKCPRPPPQPAKNGVGTFAFMAVKLSPRAARAVGAQYCAGEVAPGLYVREHLNVYGETPREVARRLRLIADEIEGRPAWLDLATPRTESA